MANQDTQTEESLLASSTTGMRSVASTAQLPSRCLAWPPGADTHTYTELTAPAAGSCQERVPWGQPPAKRLGMFLDKATKERCGRTMLGRVGMSQPSFLWVIREGFPEECAFRSFSGVWRQHLGKCWSLQADRVAQEKDLEMGVGWLNKAGGGWLPQERVVERVRELDEFFVCLIIKII